MHPIRSRTDTHPPSNPFKRSQTLTSKCSLLARHILFLQKCATKRLACGGSVTRGGRTLQPTAPTAMPFQGHSTRPTKRAATALLSQRSAKSEDARTSVFRPRRTRRSGFSRLSMATNHRDPVAVGIRARSNADRFIFKATMGRGIPEGF